MIIIITEIQPKRLNTNNSLYEKHDTNNYDTGDDEQCDLFQSK